MGILVTPKLIWSSAKKSLATQAKRAIITMSKLQSAIGYFEHQEFFKLFDSIIKPILTYGAEIWGFEESSCIKNVQNQFCKKYLK